MRFAKALMIPALIAAVAYVVALGGLYLYQDRLLYVRVFGIFNNCPQLEDPEPGSSGVVERPFQVESVDTRVSGERLRYYALTKPGARGWMIVFHGNAESACGASFYAEQLAGLPLDYALAEYPGYLADADTPSSQAALLRNAEAVYDSVALRAKGAPIYVFGRSLGTGVATYVASVRPVRGVVLFSPYTSIADVGEFQYPLVPVRWLLRDSFPASDWAARVSAPVFAVHGTADRIIPIEIGRRETTRFASARLLEVPGGSHGSIVRPEETRTWDAVREFLRGLSTR